MAETTDTEWPFDDADQHDPLAKLRIPVVRSPYPRWKYEVCLIVNDPEDRSFDPPLWGVALYPDELEKLQLVAELEWRMAYYNDTWKAKMRRRPLDVDGTTNTVILQKRAEGAWCYRRASWQHGPTMVPPWNSDERLTLEQLLDRINDYHDKPNPEWRAFKAAHPEAFPAAAMAGEEMTR